MIQNPYAKIEFRGEIGEWIDLEKERHRLSQMFEEVLKQANLGYWTGREPYRKAGKFEDV